jgi:hypothetical protein
MENLKRWKKGSENGFLLFIGALKASAIITQTGAFLPIK